MKMSVLYYSKSGNTKKMAEVIARGMQSVDGVEARTFPIEQIDETWVKESRCVVLGTPTYYADLAGTVKSFLENCKKYELAGKMGGAFATAEYLHGGGNIAIQTVLTHMMVMGMLTYSGGGAYGKPIIHQGPLAIMGRLEESEETFRLYGQRMASKAAELFR
ncbi:MAG TPA: flavodoxin family protein [Bacillota bacterium]|nr:flavodoxin family protein [Bacillota bacterium]